MNFEEIRYKLQQRWWWPLVGCLLIGLISLPLMQRSEYQSSVTITIATHKDSEVLAQELFPNVNSELAEIDPESWLKINPDNANKEYVYFRLLGTISGYFTNRFANPDIQADIARTIGLSTDNLRKEAPFYLIGNNGMGSMTFSFISSDKVKAEKFAPSVLSNMQKLVTEWNVEKEIFSLSIVESQISPSLVKLEPKIQERILPFAAGLVAALVISLLWPIKNR